MSGYVIIVSPDPDIGYKAATYQTEDDKLVAVVAMLQNNNPLPPAPTLRQVFVMVDGLNLRAGLSQNSPVIRKLAYSEVFTAYETITDADGNEWCRVGDNQWLCRWLVGGNPPEKARYL